MTNYTLTVPVTFTKDGQEKTTYRRVGAVFENTRTETGEAFLSIKLDFPVAAFACGEFLDDLLLKDVAHQYEGYERDPGHTEFQLLAEYRYKACDGTIIVVPPYIVSSGESRPTVINGGSIPQAAWSVVGGPWSGKYRNATVIHDYMYDVRMRSDKYADRIFLEAMAASGEDVWRRNTIYYAVRKFGPKYGPGAGFLSWPEIDTSGSVEDVMSFMNRSDISDLTLDEIDAIANQR